MKNTTLICLSLVNASFVIFSVLHHIILIRQLILVYTHLTHTCAIKSLSFNTEIGFTTRLRSETCKKTSTIIRGSPILYNGGKAYNGTVFTCPSPRLYLFQVSLLTNSPGTGISIYKNSQELTLAYAGNGNQQFNGASVSAVIWLDVGDQVYLRPYRSPLYIDSYSVFTGVKVK